MPTLHRRPGDVERRPTHRPAPSGRRRAAIGARILAVLVVLLAVWPARLETASAAPVYPLKVSSDGRYLVDQANQPFFWNGEAPWSLIAQGTNADIDTYLASRQQLGVNVILVNLLEHKFTTNAPRNINGDPPFTGTTFTTPNEAYFAHADYLVSQAAQKGINVLIVPLFLGYGCSDEGWCAEVQAASTSDLQSWGQYVGSRYTKFDNVVWTVGGDVDPTSISGLSAKVNAFAAALQQADPRHLITAENARGQMATTPWQGAPWLTLNSIYSTFQGTYQLGQTAYNASPTMPFFQIEGYYENEHSMTTQQLRMQAYWAVLSGGMGYTFSNCPLWGLGAPASSFCSGTSSDWKAQLNSPGSLGMKHVRDLFTSLAWQDLVPDSGHATLVAGYGTFGNTDYVTAARTPDGSLVVAALPSARTVTLDMSELSGPVAAWWYDPAAGTYASVAGSPFANSGTHAFTPAGSNSAGDGDWVLVLAASQSSASPMATSTPTATATSTLSPTATSSPTSAPTNTPTPTPTSVSAPPGTVTSVTTSQVTAGPQAAYGFNTGRGATVADSSGHGIAGALHNALWTAAGKFGGALSFNGTFSYVDLGRPSALATTGSMTWEAWVYPTGWPPDDGQIVAWSDNTTGWQLKTTPDSGPQTFGVLVSGPNGTYAQRTSRTVVSLNTWYHVAGVYNAAARALDIYVNGVLDDGTLLGSVPSADVLPPRANASIGRRTDGRGYYFIGTVDEVRIYSRALSAAEIQNDRVTPLP